MILLQKKNIQGPPDLVVEILSSDPKEIIRDKREKKMAYEQYGVNEYLIVDCTGRSVEHYFLIETRFQEIGAYKEKDKLKLKTVKGLAINLRDVFK